MINVSPIVLRLSFLLLPMDGRCSSISTGSAQKMSTSLISSFWSLLRQSKDPKKVFCPVVTLSWSATSSRGANDVRVCPKRDSCGNRKSGLQKFSRHDSHFLYDTNVSFVDLTRDKLRVIGCSLLLGVQFHVIMVQSSAGRFGVHIH